MSLCSHFLSFCSISESLCSDLCLFEVFESLISNFKSLFYFLSLWSPFVSLCSLLWRMRESLFCCFESFLFVVFVSLLEGVLHLFIVSFMSVS